MNQDLFQPSLKDQEIRITRTFDIQKLFYVAFLGGLLPTTILSYKNAKMLMLEKSQARLILILGAVGIFAKLLFMSFLLGRGASEQMVADVGNNQVIKWTFRIITVGIYYIFYRIMKAKFQQHMVTVGETQPLLKQALLWILIGGLIEFAIIWGGAGVIGYFIG